MMYQNTLFYFVGFLMKVRQDNEKYNIGKNIRALRMKNKLTQKHTAEKLQLLGIQISRGTLSHIESGRSNVDVKVLLGLADLFHVDVGEFFKGMSI